jgi:hypothetical protein
VAWYAANSCYQPCHGSYYYSGWQQAYSFIDIYQPHFVSYTNCLNNSCDWYSYGLGGFISDGGLCAPVGSCGNGDVGYVTFCIYSDESLKEGVKTLNDALSKLLEIEAVEYDWNENLRNDLYEYFKRKGRLHTIGLIAQDVRKYYPQVVGMRSDGYYFIEYHKLNAVLVEAIKSQQIFIDEIKNEIELLETKIN